MRQITFARRHSIAENRKVPMNTVILPPLTPPSQENGTEILGKFVVSCVIGTNRCENVVR